jgi:L-ascorbate metabolism protein UlaG (beta-lactamase superfamily)
MASPCRASRAAVLLILLGAVGAATAGRQPPPQGDLAFLSIFGAGPQRWINGGDRYTIEHLRPRIVFPMHAGGRERHYEAFAAEARRLNLGPLYAVAMRPGQSFDCVDGRIERR